MFKKLTAGVEDWVFSHKKMFPRHTRRLKQLITCTKCSTFYYKNSWHFEAPVYADEHREKEIAVFFELCPICLEEENALYDMESTLIVSG